MRLRTGWLLWVLGSACATMGPLVSVPQDENRLTAASDAFYRATTVADLRAAVAEAQAAGPDTARFHELAATLARLEGRGSDELSHWLAAVQDPADDQPVLHLHHLALQDLTLADRPKVREVLARVAATHPDPTARAVAAAGLASMLHAEGDLAGRDRALAGVTGRVSLAWVGTWDNDQGKGFDLELAPEARPDLDQRYEGRTGPIGWRRDVPTDPRGRYDLGEVMSPTRWSAALAQGTLHAPTDGTYPLLITTGDPLKVWVDGKLVFSAAQLERMAMDQLSIPLRLSAGDHRLLVKSAHREGSWVFMARLGPALTPTADASPVTNADEALWARVPRALRGTARGASLLVSWAHLAFGGTQTVKLADGFATLFPTSILARAQLVDAVWFNQERGRTSDLLSALDTAVGDALPFIRLRQVRFQQQQGLRLKARTRLLELTHAKPELHDAWDLLAELWRTEGWTEDELRVLETRARRFGEASDELLETSRALQRLGRRADALRVIDRVLAALPRHAEALRRLSEFQLEAGDFAAAEATIQRRLESWPVDFSAWLSLADVRHRRGDFQGAREALDRAAALSPESAVPLERRGSLAYEQGQTAAALKDWRRALELNPENEALANRVDYLAPEARGPWMADIPEESTLEALVKGRGQLKQVPGADVAFLLDHEVTQLNTDGSTSNVVSIVLHAWNAQGRDRIIRQSVGAGRLRVLQAYSVDERGVRSEASSERNRQIFFRGMQPGSTLVLQYRLDSPPRGLLARYFNESWSFQGVGEQREDSTFILWTPLGAQLHEARVGELVRTEEKRGDALRVMWRAQHVSPITVEPSMPTIGELAINIMLSTVPDWKTWLSWEQALLEGVFRDSPELDALAKTLGKGEPDAEEKFKRIHAYVMEEIRYQQDYESFIAGVKPHAAPMVLERRYGDCKDKAVLFIELARKLGLKAHFALVRTRSIGPTQRDVPMQQFNHAIVYVPDQPGVAGRFFDPTAELLDLDSVRTDDVGTQSLVFDPDTGVHTWREIPYQDIEANREHTTLELTLDEKGGAAGTLTLESVGRGGSMLRRTAKNAKVFEQATQRLAALYLPNATSSNARALEVESLRVPAAIRMDVTSGTFARAEGESLRVKLPSDANPRSTFQLATRKYPLVLGTPAGSRVDVALTVPAKWEVKKLPSSATIALPCLTLSREVKVDGGVVKSSQSYRTTCERIGVGEYAQYRARLDDMVRLLDDELVLGPKAGVKAPSAARR